MTRAIRRGVPINRAVVYYYRRYCTFIIYVYIYIDIVFLYFSLLFIRIRAYEK